MRCFAQNIVEDPIKIRLDLEKKQFLKYTATDQTETICNEFFISVARNRFAPILQFIGYDDEINKSSEKSQR